MPNEITTQQEIDQVKELEEQAMALPDVSTYTHKLKKPFTFEKKTVEEMHFDFDSLSGADTVAIESELNHRMKNLVLPHLSWEFMTLMAVRACTDRDGNGIRVVDEKLLKALPMRDYNAIIGAARIFLMSSGS